MEEVVVEEIEEVEEVLLASISKALWVCLEAMGILAYWGRGYLPLP